MNYKILFFISILLLTACQNTTTKKIPPSKESATKAIVEKTSKDNVLEKKEESSKGFITDQKYRNVGFTLIYSDKLIDNKRINKKLNNKELIIFHKKIFKNSFVKITNPENAKTIIAKVISNDAFFFRFL